jgi:hypothetical protein
MLNPPIRLMMNASLNALLRRNMHHSAILVLKLKTYTLYPCELPF